jgi:hypothetical protein
MTSEKNVYSLLNYIALYYNNMKMYEERNHIVGNKKNNILSKLNVTLRAEVFFKK